MIENCFKEFIGKKIIFKTTYGEVQKGIAIEGLKIFVGTDESFPSHYSYHIKMNEKWYDVYKDSIQEI